MAIEKRLLGRIIHKHDIEDNWNKATGFIPKQGEIIVYDIDNNYNYERFKIGDGNTTVINLPFQKTNINDLKAVSYDIPQTLTDGQKAQVRVNIGAMSADTKIPSIEGLATETYVDNKVAGLVNSAPEKLNTLDELAAALGDDENFANTVTTELGKKINSSDLASWAKSSTKPTYTASEVGADASGSASSALVNAKNYTDQAVAQKSQVQVLTSESTEVLSTLKIHKLTQEEYDQELVNGTLEDNAIYLTPEEKIDLTPYATIEQLNEKADISHEHDIEDIKELQSVLDSINELINEKIDTEHTHEVSDINNLQELLNEKVDINTTINGKPLSENISLTANDIGADNAGSADSALANAKSYADNAVSQKTQVQIITWEDDD